MLLLIIISGIDTKTSKSAYVKDALQHYINENTILYIDPNKKRTNDWLSLNRLQLPLGENQYGSIRRISYDGNTVKVQNSKNRTPMEIALEKAGVVDEYGKPKFPTRENEDIEQRSIQGEPDYLRYSYLDVIFVTVILDRYYHRGKYRMIRDYIDTANFEDTGFSYTLSLISGKHKMVILYCLMEFGSVRFNQLKRYLKNISDKTLSRTLKELEADLLLVRTVYPQIPPRVEYTLSDRGRSLMVVLDQLCVWGERNKTKRAQASPED